MYTHIKRREKIERNRIENVVKTVCSFINPAAAKTVFDKSKAETSVNTGFLEDLKKLNPGFDPSKYEDVLTMMEVS